MATTTRTQVQFRSAKTGEFTTRKAAEKSPNTHVRERNQIPTSPTPKKGG